MIKIPAFLLVLVSLGGCATAPEIRYERVNVAVPVPCDAEIPAAPPWMLDILRSSGDADLDKFVAHALAEREQREGYEGQLLAALRECTKPVTTRK